MTMTEAANYLGISLLTLRNRVKQYGMTVYRGKVDTRQRLVRRADIEALKSGAEPMGKFQAA
jgi:excisionase family DNA binding protein